MQQQVTATIHLDSGRMENLRLRVTPPPDFQSQSTILHLPPTADFAWTVSSWHVSLKAEHMTVGITLADMHFRGLPGVLSRTKSIRTSQSWVSYAHAGDADLPEKSQAHTAENRTGG